MRDLATLPTLGVGIGFRRQLAQSIFDFSQEIDWLEIISENYMNVGGSAREALENSLDTFPVLPHGVNLNVGGTDPLDNEYLKSLSGLIRQTKAPWTSDHLCFTSNGGRHVHQLLPLPRTKQTVEHVVRRVREIQSRLEIPFLLENITYYMTFSESTMTESQFLSEICAKADCGILLDLNNIVVNAKNFDLNPEDFIDEIDAERVVQMHVAGHKVGKNWVLDTHAEPISGDVYELLDYALARTSPKAVLLERDDNFPDFYEILSEFQVIKAHCEKLGKLEPKLASVTAKGALQCH